MTRPRIAVSMGDPGGIGPEVALKALSQPRVKRACQATLVGDHRFLRSIAKRIRISAKITTLGAAAHSEQEISVLDVGKVRGAGSLGKPTKHGGEIAGRMVEELVRLATSGAVEGVVTSPVSKESLALAGYGMIGHTELIANLTDTKNYAMMVVRGKLRVVFATTHHPLRSVPKQITRDRVLRTIKLAQEYLQLYMGIRQARIGICCLNPHCGEGGYLGQEEQQAIQPAIVAARRQGISVEGPYPADSIYRRVIASRLDAIVAMYHDQGMIPLKIKDHDDVVNITIGIPFVRTSPGHGTAFDIAGKGRASEKSMIRAILECARIAKRLRHVGRIQECGQSL